MREAAFYRSPFFRAASKLKCRLAALTGAAKTGWGPRLHSEMPILLFVRDCLSCESSVHACVPCSTTCLNLDLLGCTRVRFSCSSLTGPTALDAVCQRYGL